VNFSAAKYFLLALAVSGFVSHAQAGSIDAIEAFGDSLSDVGNIYFLSSGTIPAAPYVNGQFSNGNVWVQDLASALGVGPLKASLLGGTDYAYGSAQSGTTPNNTAGQFDLTGTTGQIAQFQIANPGGADPNALYTIWIGSNDLGAIPAAATLPQIAIDTADIIANIDSAINTLAGMGAKNFLVVTVPDLGKTPDVTAMGGLASANASAISAGFDNALVNGSGPIPSLAGLAALDGINIATLNSYLLLDSIIAFPGSFGFTNVTDPCLTGAVNYAGGTPCAMPNQYLFWDGTHPTAAANVVVADAAFEVVVPEPSSVMLSGAGLCGMLGLLLRRRYCGNR
jgi:phospholipase/lecithinase/hemolysin